MGVKKFQNLFKNNEASAKKTEASSKKTKEVDMEASKDTTNSNTKNVADKASVEQMKKLIQNKLQDPAMAKKAAQIISELLNGDSKK